MVYACRLQRILDQLFSCTAQSTRSLPDTTCAWDDWEVDGPRRTHGILSLRGRAYYNITSRR
jgi:hypothetical protein